MSKTDPTGGHPPGKPRVLVGLALAAGILVIALVAFFYRGRLGPDEPVRPVVPPKEEPVARGKHLYEIHCAQCHGEKGDGKGPAARFLYPKPRNFGEGQFRLVTTTNSLPSDEDLLRVITRGMPGSAMVPFGHLSESDRHALVVQVRQLIRSGIEESLRQGAADGKVDQKLVAELTQPGEPLKVPAAWSAATPESLARGSALYRSQGCAGCHGDTGKGDGGQEQKDSDGMPTRPRDFTLGIFKGGQDHSQLYARIRQGMAGTPMPSSQLADEAVGDVINFVLSLVADPHAQARVEHKRATVVARRAPGALADEVPEQAWSDSQPVPIVVSPLWWRSYTPPDLRVQALHDGQSLAIRLTWRDATRNDLVERPEDFEDMGAVQLFQGEVEPFLGMGADASKIDLWLWRATWQRPVSEANSILDFYPFDERKTGGRDYLTAAAAGNLNANPERAQSASSLAAKGFGSTTFRPKASQRVTARSEWKDGQWTVVLRRPLQVGAEDGQKLIPGESYSVAFAVWDGAARDRNGQKLISIWHDLKLE